MICEDREGCEVSQLPLLGRENIFIYKREGIDPHNPHKISKSLILKGGTCEGVTMACEGRPGSLTVPGSAPGPLGYFAAPAGRGPFSYPGAGASLA